MVGGVKNVICWIIFVLSEFLKNLHVCNGQNAMNLQNMVMVFDL